MAIRSAALLFALLVAPAQAPQPQRGVLPVAGQSRADWKPKRRIVVTIGIDRYKNWPRLANAVSDASEVSEVLRAAGFAEVVPPLLNESADRKAILHLIETQLPDKLEDDDDLVLFFAGHGTSRKSKVGPDTFTSGYLVPADASHPDRNEWSDYLPLGALLESIGTLPPRHVLLILDSCRSGVALGRVVEMSRSPNSESGSARVSRMVITSADADQDASDAGPVPGHSLFTGTLLNGLKTGDADLDKDGVITDAELALYVKSQVKKARGSQQTPNSGQFLADNRGEMSFPKPDLALIVPPAPQTGKTPTVASVRLPEPPSDLSANRGPRRAVRQAIVIGCDRYRDFPLRYAVADAEGVGHAFETLGYQVWQLDNPTRAQVLEAIAKAVHGASSDLGSLMFFFSGIGFSDSSGIPYLALSDFDAQDLQTTALNYRELQTLLLQSSAQQKVFFIDAAFHSADGRPPRTMSQLQLSFDQVGTYGAMLASRRNERSEEDATLGHGVFSYFLMRGLRGDASDRDGVITLEALIEYVGREVRMWTQNRQSLIDTGDLLFPVGVVPASAEPLPPIPAQLVRTPR